ncbi:replication factor A protein 3 [Polychaeton citri CBS 116435]|uniref:Replication factor A protein 3 n=1 Tax=Polychaeton citri CBS 116435 TaxID=1314669 RepID=A0A9P4UPP0_9PEZI|nr:replication factor A protein 3 [Polychaeton citri CBS 116435]
MAEPTATPRITAQYLEQFAHQTVRILGKVRQLRGESATIDSGGQINIHLNRDAHLQLNHAAEIIGKVQNDLSVKVMAATDFGPEGNIDFNAYEAVVDATHRYNTIFYTSQE